MGATKQQKKIARQLGISVSKTDTSSVMAAKIRDYVAVAINDREEAEPTENQIEYAESLGIKIGRDSRRVVSAKINDELVKRNQKALKKLKLKPGDKVKLKEGIDSRDSVVSSIKENGKIYFKGIGCRQAWATQIEKKLNDES